jgi:predicted amidophosphoribosyltransferase
MTKFENTSPQLLKRIDELLIGHHPHLQEDHEVYYLGEYTNGKRAEFSRINQMVLNYKKELKRKEYPDWKYKETAIQEIANLFRLSILQTSGFPERIQRALLVPIPPHASKNDPDYDDRNLRMLRYFMPKGKIHELMIQKQSRNPLHLSKQRDPKELENNYLLIYPKPEIEFDEIWLFDDVLRDGTHFRAIHNILVRTFPKIKIIGFFVARSVQYFPDPPVFAGAALF